MAADFRTVSHVFEPAPIDVTNLAHDYLEMLYREALRGTTDHFLRVIRRGAENGRPVKAISLSRDAKLLFAPAFRGGRKLPGPGDVLRCTTVAAMVGRAYYANHSVITFEERRGPEHPAESFRKGDIIAGVVLGFVFVDMLPDGWRPSRCPEELIEGGWTAPSPFASDPAFSFLLRAETPADAYIPPSARRLPPTTWTARFTDTDGFGHVTARKRSYPFFEHVYASFPNAGADPRNPRRIPVAPNSVVGYYVEFKTEQKVREQCSVEGGVLPAGDGMVEVRMTLQGEATKGVNNRAAMLLVADGDVVPVTGRGRVVIQGSL
ncbi:hypothetical protein DFJ74DRAFT_666284 [Hyaloraphidium curvatum]|nr:hypothetical protein DFJ74DRAFT_666284 [Hyaloraphidium curvatum]